MMLFKLLLRLAFWVLAHWQLANAAAANGPQHKSRQTQDGLQSLVTWDEHSLFIRGERIMFMSGEFHPYRLPSTDLYIDVFQKIKALGYTGVSFYTNWALLEGQQGSFRSEGVFDLEPFFNAAAQAGIYLLARPGPYINAEVSGGGFPGWLNNVEGPFRTNMSSYLDATNLYASSIGQIISKAQITNGGPVILLQPENEYTFPENNITFPNVEYFKYVEDQFRNVGITVPLVSNDAAPLGHFAPANKSTAPANVDIYGHDSYPQGFDCQQPYEWTNGIPTTFRLLHEEQSPSTAYTITEFQGGSFDPWGGYGYDNCAILTNEQFERVFYKNNWSFGITLFNIYMTFGGTNWGNLGHPLGYTSYDYGSVISEDRAITRAKYSEAKLAANFLKVTPSYLTSTPLNYTNGTYTDTTAITITPLLGNGSNTNLYVVRQSAYNSSSNTSYRFTVPTTAGNITIPQLSNLANSLSLDGRDSKVHVTDYNVGGTNLLYSSGEIFTWQNYSSGTILVLYGDVNETHEFAIPEHQTSLSGGNNSTIAIETRNGFDIVQWQVTPEPKQVQSGNLTIYLLWRQAAYDWWVVELPGDSPVGNYTSPSKQSVVVNGGYLLRTAQLMNGNLYLTGDVNTTTPITVAAAPSYNELFFNGQAVSSPTFTVNYTEPMLGIPKLSTVSWRSIDSLPEITPSYSDALWTVANHTNTTNQFRPQTPTVLYASDYGYYNGPLLYRGHFTSPSDVSNPLNLTLHTQGGYAYGYSVYLNSTLQYLYPGLSTSESNNYTLALSNVTANTPYVITLIVDHLGLTENFNPGNDTQKEPRGLLYFDLVSGTDSVSVEWKLTGNLGGENYEDLTRGPLNEAGLYFERQGYHLPGAPTNSSEWTTASPFDGFTGSGVKFYSTTFDLELPTPQYDIPLAIVFTNTSTTDGRPTRFRSNIYVNGWQFGRYTNNIGPQTSYPVPEGILNYHGSNYIGVSIWSLEEEGVEVKLGGFELQESSTPVLTGRGTNVGLSYTLPQDGWHERPGAY